MLGRVGLSCLGLEFPCLGFSLAGRFARLGRLFAALGSPLSPLRTFLCCSWPTCRSLGPEDLLLDFSAVRSLRFELHTCLLSVWLPSDFYYSPRILTDTERANRRAGFLSQADKNYTTCHTEQSREACNFTKGSRSGCSPSGRPHQSLRCCRIASAVFGPLPLSAQLWPFSDGVLRSLTDDTASPGASGPKWPCLGPSLRALWRRDLDASTFAED